MLQSVACELDAMSRKLLWSFLPVNPCTALGLRLLDEVAVCNNAPSVQSKSQDVLVLEHSIKVIVVAALFSQPSS